MCYIPTRDEMAKQPKMRTCARTSSKSDVTRLRTFVLSHSSNVKTTKYQHPKHTSTPKTYLSSQKISQQPKNISATTPKVMAETEGYSPGGDAELYISATLALLLGLMFTALGIVNLFGNLLGPKGKIFIFEMDQVTTLFVEESSDQPSR